MRPCVADRWHLKGSVAALSPCAHLLLPAAVVGSSTMVLLPLPYRQTEVFFEANGSHYTWWETVPGADVSVGGGIYVKTLPVHDRTWWWCQQLGRWRRVQWTLEEITRSDTGPGWDIQWSWAYMDASEIHQERAAGPQGYPLRTWFPESYSPVPRTRMPGRSTPF